MVGFGTVVYPAAMKYIDEFIMSLNRQTMQDFTLFVINDHVDKDSLESHLSSFRGNVIVVENDVEKSPADLRVDLIKESKLHQCELLFLGDVDDIFDENRVRSVYHFYTENREFEFYYNRLLLFDKSPALRDFPPFTTSIGQLLEHNYLGLSNTSINLSRLSVDFIDSLYGCTSFVFDWYLYSRIVLNSGSGAYIEDAVTFYRIYDNNFAGVSAEKQFIKEFEVKKKHYTLMRNYNTLYEELYKKLLELDISTIEPTNSLSYWWDSIKMLEE